MEERQVKKLINLLGHVGCIPLLIASKQLGENKFYAIVSKVELFFFNAKVICNIHAESFLEKYREEIVEIRRDPQAYNVSSLVNKLNNIRTRNNCDSEFVVKLPQLLVYNGAIKKNTIKYFLYMINLFYLSFRTPGQYIEPVSTINYCIAGLNIEHIYPRKAKGTQINSTLEPLKDSLGNLVIMCEAINSNRLRSKTFALKKPYYRNCGFKSAESLFALADWSATEVANRELDYVNLATKIFVDNNNI